MNRVVPVAALVLAGAALAVSVFANRAEEPPEPPSSGPEEPLADLDGADLEERVAALESRADFLSQRITALERRGSGDGGSGAPVPADVASELAELRQEVRGLVVGEALHSEGGRAHLKEAVRAVGEEIVAEERAARAAKIAEAAAASADRWSAFAREAGLRWDQEQLLNQHASAERERQDALVNALRAGGDVAGTRRELNDARRRTNQAMRGTLNEEQWRHFRAIRQAEGGGQRERPR